MAKQYSVFEFDYFIGDMKWKFTVHYTAVSYESKKSCIIDAKIVNIKTSVKEPLDELFIDCLGETFDIVSEFDTVVNFWLKSDKIIKDWITNHLDNKILKAFTLLKWLTESRESAV